MLGDLDDKLFLALWCFYWLLGEWKVTDRDISLATLDKMIKKEYELAIREGGT